MKTSILQLVDNHRAGKHCLEEECKWLTLFKSFYQRPKKKKDEILRVLGVSVFSIEFICEVTLHSSG